MNAIPERSEGRFSLSSIRRLSHSSIPILKVSPPNSGQSFYPLQGAPSKNLRWKENNKTNFLPTLLCIERHTLADTKAQCYIIVISVSLNILMSWTTDILAEYMSFVGLVTKQKKKKSGIKTCPFKKTHNFLKHKYIPIATWIYTKMIPVTLPPSLQASSSHIFHLLPQSWVPDSYAASWTQSRSFWARTCLPGQAVPFLAISLLSSP